MKSGEAWNALSALPMNARIVVLDGDEQSDLSEITMKDGNVVIRLQMRPKPPEMPGSAALFAADI